MTSARGRALRLIVLMGVISLFADITYEGARSVSGPFLLTLGASSLAVGLVAGGGEWIGYALRLVSGVLTDRTRRYWVLLFLGYGLNLAVVPLLVLAESWPMAAVLLLLERTGKAIRAPARDVVLASAASHTGMGWGFGLHEALDQIGAVTGPLLVAGVLSRNGGYASSFAWLGVPAACALLALAAARIAYPDPAGAEPRRPEANPRGLPHAYWLYLAAAALSAFGFVDFPLLAYHAKRTALAPDTWIPLGYAAAMGVDAVAALVFGRWFDRAGLRVLIPAALLGAAAVPLLFAPARAAAAVGVVLWGACLGAQESVLRAAIAHLAPPGRRGSAYGLFHAVFGAAWFAGSAVCGALYAVSLPAAAACAVAAQVSAVPLFAAAARTSYSAGRKPASL